MAAGTIPSLEGGGIRMRVDDPGVQGAGGNSRASLHNLPIKLMALRLP